MSNFYSIYAMPFVIIGLVKGVGERVKGGGGGDSCLCRLPPQPPRA